MDTPTVTAQGEGTYDVATSGEESLKLPEYLGRDKPRHIHIHTIISSGDPLLNALRLPKCNEGELESSRDHAYPRIVTSV